jgi:hypothetical protein
MWKNSWPACRIWDRSTAVNMLCGNILANNSPKCDLRELFSAHDTSVCVCTVIHSQTSAINGSAAIHYVCFHIWFYVSFHIYIHTPLFIKLHYINMLFR